jgi:Spy/CpxP family protein refolding chaperone
MSLNKKSAWICALAIGLLATAAASSAGAFGGRRGGPPDITRLERRLERLDLSADVRKKAFAILDGARGDERALREQLRAAHDELGAMVKAGAPDGKALDAKIDELGALRTQQHKQFLHTVLKIGALMPDAQRAQWMDPPHRDRPHGHHPH